MSTDCQREMPRYKCHKEVWALTIFDIRKPIIPEDCEWDGSMELVPVEEGYAPFKVSSEYMQKHKPQIGGMYVVYKDGYKSFSPFDVFADGYTRV